MKTIFKYFLLVSLLIASPLLARTKLQGIVEKGGQNILTSGLQSTTKSVRTFPGATVTVYSAGTTTLAALYTNSSGTIKPNPFTADTDAAWAFFIDDGTYDIKFSPSGFTVWTLSSISVGSSGAFIAAPPPSGGDDFYALQTLISTYSPAGITINIQDSSYLISAELSIPSDAHGLILSGVSGKYDIVQGTSIKLTSTARSCIASSGNVSVQIEGIKFDANRLGTYAIYLNGWTWSELRYCVFENAKIDGAFLAAAEPNGQDSSRFVNCTFYANGTTYATTGCIAQYSNGTRTLISGTATTAIGNPVVTFVGAPDLTTLNIRKGDFLRVGATTTGQIVQIQSVTASTITLQVAAANLPTIAASGQAFAIGVGDGLHETRQTNNNVNHYINCTTRSNGGSGFRFNGIYGPTSIGGQADFNNFFGAALFESDNASSTNGAVILHLYTEQNNTADYFLGQGTNIFVIAANDDAVEPTIAGAVSASGFFNGADILYGKDQSFAIQLTRTGGGVLQHRIISDLLHGSGSSASDRINGASPTYANTPALDATTGFVSGAGTFGSSLVLDTATQFIAPFGSAPAFEENTTGATVRASLGISSVNINGVTHNRLTLYLVDITGAEASWVATIGNGQSIVVRLYCKIR